MRLSKSKYLSGSQCPLRLWQDCHARGRGTPPDASTLGRFRQGREVGELARQRWIGGQLVSAPASATQAALTQTAKYMADEDVPAVFEAAFVHQDVLVRVDVLERAQDENEGSGWNLVEVKSSTSLKAVYVEDVALQAWVVSGAGVSLRDAGVLVLNRDYVFDGEQLDLSALFAWRECTDDTQARSTEITRAVPTLHAVVADEKAPDIEPGGQCLVPYPCPYFDYCTRDWVFPAHPITELPNLHRTRREALEAQGVSEIAEIPAGFDLSDLQSRVWACVRTQSEWVSPELADTLALDGPYIHFLDFETFAPAIPRYKGTRPYQAIPFQFSVHTQGPDGIRHREYLHDEDNDPRAPLAQALLDALSEAGTIVMYSSYERRVIRELAAFLPDLGGALTALVPRLWDLLGVIRQHYYHPGFLGSFSIKRVVPVLVPDLDYSELSISDGEAAARAYAGLLAASTPEERVAIANDLREYCGQDSWAMLALRRALLERSRTGENQDA